MTIDGTDAMLRAALPEDSAGIATVLIGSRRVFLPFAPSVHPDHDVRQWVSSTLVRCNRVFVWEEAGSIVAVLAISAVQAQSWINQLYVLPGWNRRGIGTRLLMHAHSMLPAPIYLYTFQENAGARRFYERNGYQAVAFSDGQSNEEKCPDILYQRSEGVPTIYRQAVVGEALCISVLASQVFLDTYATRGVNHDLAVEVTSTLSMESIRKRLERQSVELFIADHAGYMVGFMDLDFESSCPHAAVTGVEVFRIYVQQPLQRQGIGCALMRLAEERARCAGHQAVWLTAWAGNLAAREFYRALGFKDVGPTEYLIAGKAYENRILVKQLEARPV